MVKVKVVKVKEFMMKVVKVKEIKEKVVRMTVYVVKAKVVKV